MSKTPITPFNLPIQTILENKAPRLFTFYLYSFENNLRRKTARPLNGEVKDPFFFFIKVRDFAGK